MIRTPSPAPRSTALTSSMRKRVKSFATLCGLLVSLRLAELGRDGVLQHALPLANEAGEARALARWQNGEGAFPRKLHQRADGRALGHAQKLLMVWVTETRRMNRVERRLKRLPAIAGLDQQRQRHV